MYLGLTTLRKLTTGCFHVKVHGKLKEELALWQRSTFFLLIKIEGKKRITDKRFRKQIYTSQEDAHIETVAIHFIGDETLSVSQIPWKLPETNRISKQTRIEKQSLYTSPYNPTPLHLQSDLIFNCTKCQQWYHPDCQEIKLNERQLKQSRTVKRLECRSK